MQLTATFTAEIGASSGKKGHQNHIDIRCGVYRPHISSLPSVYWDPYARRDKLCFRFARRDKLWFHPSIAEAGFGHKEGPWRGQFRGWSDKLWFSTATDFASRHSACYLSASAFTAALFLYAGLTFLSAKMGQSNAAKKAFLPL